MFQKVKMALAEVGGRASGGFEAEEQCREVSVDPRVGSPRREGRLGFGELSSR